MCGYVQAGLAALSGGMQILGQQQQAKAAQQSAQFNADVAQEDARVAEKNVRRIQIQGASEEQQQRIKTAQLLGTQKANYGASGIVSGYGTPEDIQRSTQMMGTEDLLTLRQNNKNLQRQSRQQSLDFINQANMALMGGQSAKASANMASMGSFLDTAGSIYNIGQKNKYWGGKS